MSTVATSGQNVNIEECTIRIVLVLTDTFNSSVCHLESEERLMTIGVNEQQHGESLPLSPLFLYGHAQ